MTENGFSDSGGRDTSSMEGKGAHMSKRNEGFRHLTEGVGVDADSAQDGNTRAFSSSQTAGLNHGRLVGVCAPAVSPRLNCSLGSIPWRTTWAAASGGECNLFRPCRRSKLDIWQEETGNTSALWSAAWCLPPWATLLITRFSENRIDFTKV